MNIFKKLEALTNMYLEALIDLKKVGKVESYEKIPEFSRVERLRVELTKEMVKLKRNIINN